MLHQEPADLVDQMLEDAINAGVTAPEGSTRRAAARQIWDQLQALHHKKGARIRDLMQWTRNGVYSVKEDKVRNIITSRLLGKKGSPGSRRSPRPRSLLWSRWRPLSRRR